MKVKKESEKAGLKLNMQKTKIMPSSTITSWQVGGGDNGNSDRLYFLGLQNHCRWWLQHEIKRHLLLGRKSYEQPRQHIKKQRHYFANKGLYSQSNGFSSSHVGMWELDHNAFDPWCWRRLLIVPWTAKQSNQSILKEIKPEFSLEGLMLKLKLQ